MNPTLNRRSWLAAALAAHAAWPAIGRPADGRAWTLSIVPQFPPAKLLRDWTPVAERIERDAGIRLALKLQPTIPAFEAEVLAGAADFAYLNPYHQVMAQRAQGFIPLVRDSQLLSGILVVRKDDPITSVRALDGKEIAFPAPNAFGASLWMRALLAEREKISVRPVYVQTHGNVYRQVAAGRAAAGGGIAHTLGQERDEVRQSLRVLLETPGAAPHPVSAHPRVPATVRQAVGEALLRLARDAEGRELLKAVQLAEPVTADHRRDYAPLADFKLEQYVVRAEPAPP